MYVYIILEDISVLVRHSKIYINVTSQKYNFKSDYI